MSEKPENLIVAYCGLVCSNCGMYIKGKCQGCHSDKPMNTNCKMKACAIEHEYVTCADCQDYEELQDCKKLNNIVSKIMGFVFRTDRIGNLYQIRELGLEVFKEKKFEEGKP